ncbi:uncharacterized protein LOC126262190 isoform X2 [Schistocerca nitens]|uniref:uncharacterized protein LOC126262190 isoform X2 n=1 Tax=Schistocerca nitens TaxID=7011 RepID=UPI002118D156|nr:uncharacterized protein LOC126262190 isoform X2 [Schistocerca nitens]
MSCEGIIQSQKDSGQIEDANAKTEDSEAYFQINLNYKCADICQDIDFNNQDVSSPLINIQNVRLIPTNSPEQENSDCKTAELLVQDTGSCSGDVWLKSNVANDIDSLLRSESTETGCRLSAESNNTVHADLTRKKYVVTTSSDGLLSFDLLADLPENTEAPSNSQNDSDRILTLPEDDAGSVTLLERGDDLEQGRLTIPDRKKRRSDLDNSSVQIVALSLSDTGSECSEESYAKEKSIVKDLNCKIAFQDVLKDKLESQNGPVCRKYGTEFDTSKDIEDLSEFNLFTFPVDSVFQIDANDDVNNLHVSSDHEEDENITLEKVETEVTETCEAQPITILTSSLSSNEISNTRDKHAKNLDTVEGEANFVAFSTTAQASRERKSHKQATISSQRMLSENVRFPRKKTVVAISTDNTKNTADIPVVIDTSCEGQVFTGKSAKLLDVVSLWNTEKANSSVPLKESNTGHAPNDEYPVQLPTEVENSSSSSSSSSGGVLKTYSKSAHSEDSKPGDHVVEQALAEIGISAEDLSPITTENDQKLWVCPVKSCNKIFPRLCMLRIHILCHYGIRPYKCDYQGCEWSFYTYFKLKRHKETHLKKKDYMCPVDGCGRCFTTIYNLNTHVKLHERPAVMVCPVESCGARFQTKRSMEVHMRTHDSLHAPYKCPFEGCGKLYYSSNCLHSHSRVHLHKEEELRCPWEGCGKLFDQPCRLKAHMRIHTGVKPYKCTFKDCTWAFESASKLKRHQYKHTNERKYHCMMDGCGKSFLRSEHLKEHTLTHMPERTFKCPVENCGQKFSAKSSLYVHAKKHNASKGDQQAKATFCCPIEKCNRSYSMKSSLRQHMLKIHTPVLEDTTQLEYITLLTANDDSGSLEGLEMLSEDGQLTSPGGNTPAKGMNIVPPPSALITAEGRSDINDLMNKDFGSKGGETMTQFLLAPTETEITATNIQSVQDDSGTEVISDTCFIVTAASMPVPLTEETVVTSEFHEEESCKGSARTDFTYEDICTWKKQSMNLEEDAASSSNDSPLKQALNPEVCASDPEMSQIVLQDETLNIQVDTQEDNLMTISDTYSEYQVLILEQQSNVKQFSESTINLRDLQ